MGDFVEKVRLLSFLNGHCKVGDDQSTEFRFVRSEFRSGRTKRTELRIQREPEVKPLRFMRETAVGGAGGGGQGL